MIPVWTEDSEIKKAFGSIMEECIFCNQPTRTWHENTNNPVCVKCAGTYKVSDIKKDWGEKIRARKRAGIFDRGDSIRAN